MHTRIEQIENTYQNNLKSKYNSLTKRELSCLKLIIYGYSAKEIAKKLFISHRTVESHIAKIKTKFNVNKKIELVYISIKNKIIDDD